MNNRLQSSIKDPKSPKTSLDFGTEEETAEVMPDFDQLLAELDPNDPVQIQMHLGLLKTIIDGTIDVHETQK